MKKTPRYIFLGSTRHAIVDFDDYDWLSQWRWFFRCGRYAARRVGAEPNSKAIFMHRVLMQTPSEMHTDHINGDGLDNRRCNLRVCTPKQNHQNQRPQLRAKASKYKGVSFCSYTGRWLARCKTDGVAKNLGRYDTPEEAAKAYNVYAANLFGEFACLNQVG